MTARRATTVVVLVGMLLSVLLAGVASFHASSAPDGLERVAADTGFGQTARDSANAEWPLADYGDEGVGVGAAGLIGVAITALVGLGLFAVLRPRTSA